MVAQVLRHRLSGVEALLDLGVGDVAGDDHRPGEHHPGPHRMRRQLGEDLGHRAIEVDVHDVDIVEVLFRDFWEESRRVPFELLEEHAVTRDLAERLAIGRARHCHRHGTARSVPRQADDPHVVAEVLATELGADPGALGEREHLAFEIEVAEPMAGRRANRRKRVEVVRRRQLGGLDGELGRRPADDDGEVVGRAGGGSERLQLLEQPGQQRVLVEQRLGLLEQV